MTSAAIESDVGHVATLLRCPRCAHEFTAGNATTQCGVKRCPVCNRRLTPVDWPRMLRRVALIAFGVLIQLTTGLVAYLIPPGPSVLAWALYLGMGVIGFLHIFIGLEMKPSPEERAAQRAARAQRNQVELVEDDVIDARCPGCREDLALALAQRVRRCPRCRRPFALRDLGFRSDDPAGELMRLGPAELRMSGRGGAIVIALVVIAVIGLSALIWTARAGRGMGSNAAPAPTNAPTPAQAPQR